MSDPDWAALMRSSLAHLLEKPLMLQPDVMIVLLAVLVVLALGVALLYWRGSRSTWR